MESAQSAKSWAFDTTFRLARKHPSAARAYNLARRMYHRWRYSVDSPYMFHCVEMETNSMCNRKCVYCPNVSAKRPNTGYMETSLFQKIIGELAEIHFEGRVSYHFYGEPLLDKRLPDFVEYTRKHVPRSETEIVSNGDFLDLGVFREYLRRGLDNFLITQHDNLMPPNLQELVDNITPEEAKHIAIRFAKDRDMINRSGLIEYLGIPKAPLKVACDWPLSTMVITLNGNVVLCCNDYFETEVVGNVRTHSLREVWTNERFTNFRRVLALGDRTASPLCVKCDYVPPKSQLQRIVPF